MPALLYALFFASGSAGLMYESVWARYLGLFVGHQAYAQILVLVIFLGGMSLGAAVVSRRAGAIRNPLLAYAVIEVITGLIGIGFHPVFTALTSWAYDHGFPATGGGIGSEILKWGLAAVLILPQSILLGTTFPLMSAGVLRRAPSAPGRVLGWLYFTNSLGAAIGVLVAGFVIVEWLGLPGVLHVAAGINLVVGIGAGLVAIGRRAPDEWSPPASAALQPQQSDGSNRLLLGAAFFTAIASFCYEIDWIRMLSLVLGSATHSFELMLSAFILGLALGAFWIRPRTDSFSEPLRALAIIQITMGLLAAATLPLYLGSFRGMEALLTSLARNDSGYRLFTIVRYTFCLAVMLPATICAGMTLPLITRSLLVRGAGERAIGQVYTVNTLGSIIGVALAGLYLLPLLGLKGLAILGGSIDIAVGLVLLHRAAPRLLVRWTAISSAAMAGLALLVPFDRGLLTSGVFRGYTVAASIHQPLLYYEDGRTATVSVREYNEGTRTIATNGKVDASLSRQSRLGCKTLVPGSRRIDGDETTQLLAGIIPYGYRRDVTNAAVIGIGSGMTTHTLLANPVVKSVTTIEIEPRMIDGATFFLPGNTNTFDDPRSHLVVADAKAWFASSPGKFELIVSEPSNPWVSGVSSLFTEEFYGRVRATLAPQGIFAQWIQAYALDDSLLVHILSALDRSFPDWTIHVVDENDLLIIASADRRLPEPEWAPVVAWPTLQINFCNSVPLDTASLMATTLGGRKLFQPLMKPGTVANSDFQPVLDLNAERRQFQGKPASLPLIADEWFNLSRELQDNRQLPVETENYPFTGIRRSKSQYLQTWQSRAIDADAVLPIALAQARFEWRQLDQVLRLQEAPADWHAWLRGVATVGGVRHAGTAGWVDSAFFDRLEAFAARNHAPQEVHDVIAFRRAVQGWDAPAAMAAAGKLVKVPTPDGEWITADELREGAVVAALRTGDRSAANGWWTILSGRKVRDPGDIRSMILLAMVKDGVGAPTVAKR